MIRRVVAASRKRNGSARAMAELNQTLEARVAERTKQLADRHSFTEALLETTNVGIVSCDADGTNWLRNRAVRAMLGFDATAAHGLDPKVAARQTEVLDPAGKQIATEDYPLLRALRGEDVGMVELHLGPLGGPLREVLSHSSQIIGSDGEVLGAVTAMTDISAERAAARLYDAERLKLIEAQRVGQIGSFEYDFAADVWDYSDQMAMLWGVAPDGLDALATRALIVDEDREVTHQRWRDACRLGGRHTYEYRIRRAGDRAERHLRSTVEIELDAAGQPARGRGTHLDITELTAAEQAAQQANTFLNAVLAATPDFTFISELATGAVVYGSRDKDILGIGTDQLEALGKGVSAALVHPEDQPRLLAMNDAAADLLDGHVLVLRYRAMHADGHWRWLNRRITPFRRDSAGNVVEVLGVLRDISDIMEAERRLTHAALHDDLTGLPNRSLLIDRLDAALVRSGRDGREIAVLYCDLDGFKRVNDTAGHAAGNVVLVETARRLSAVLRPGDTVARVGGDEFVIVVEPWNRTDRAGQLDTTTHSVEEDRTLSVRVAERVGAAVGQPITVHGVEHVVTASIGITYAGLAPGALPGSMSADQVLEDADAAMYLAKGHGKDRFEIFEHGLRTDPAERGRVEHLLRQALAPFAPAATESGRPAQPVSRAAFAAAYQPVFDSSTGELVSFEALARLADADGVAIPPDVFIATAELTGLIHPLGRVMLSLACGQLSAWRAEMPGLQNVSMAVNVSALQAQYAALNDDVRFALAAHDLNPTDLILELTETALLQVAHSTITALRALHAEGVGIAIDDFGTGYASLRYLAALPVSAVKVDRSFTAGLPHDQTSSKIVKAVAALAADMGLTCVVEGVETAEQLAALPAGVHVQGFFTGRPQLPADTDLRQILSGLMPAAKPERRSVIRSPVIPGKV